VGTVSIIQASIGEWTNKDSDTGGITRVHIRRDGTRVMVHMWGRCYPTECDWGETEATEKGSILLLTWDQKFYVRTQELRALTDGSLQVIEHCHFTDSRDAKALERPAFQRLSLTSRRLLAEADSQARARDEDHIGTEHIMLAIPGVPRGQAHVRSGARACWIDVMRGRWRLRIVALNGSATYAAENGKPVLLSTSALRVQSLRILTGAGRVGFQRMTGIEKTASCGPLRGDFKHHEY